jgi:hypothetical protein
MLLVAENANSDPPPIVFCNNHELALVKKI